MPLTTFETIHPADRPLALPLSLELTGPRLGPWVMTLLLVPLAGLALAPFALLAAHALENGGAREIMLARPLAALQLGLGFLILLAGMALALTRAMAGIGRKRSIDISDGHVHVRDRTPFGRRQWSAPLAEYAGLSHHIRATLSGARHELILVHPKRSRTLLLHIAPRLTRSEVAATAAALGLAEVDPAALYRRSRSGAIAATGHDPEPIVA